MSNKPQNFSSFPDDSDFIKNIGNYITFLAWARWFPDLFLDLITPKSGSIKLGLDQRIFLRILVRFPRAYIVFPRGYGKTFVEVLGLILNCIFYPNINLSMTAQTRESACGLLEDKFTEIMTFYPMLKDCVEHVSFTKDKALIIFKNGSRISNLANHQSSKGKRRHSNGAAIIEKSVMDTTLKPVMPKALLPQ